MLRTILIISLLFFTACSSTKTVRPGEPAGFIPRHEDGLVSENTPFDYSWVDRDNEFLTNIVKTKSYKLYVAPVDISYLPEEIQDDEDYQEVAQFLRYQIIDQIEEHAENDNQHVQAIIVEDVEPGTVVLKVAITELNTGRPVAYAATMAVPVPGASFVYDKVDSPILAIEGKYVVAQDGDLLLTFADRNAPKMRPFDLTKLSRFKPLRDMSEDIANDIARVSETKFKEKKVERKSRFSLSPW